jgi:hypothetical protein
MPNNIFVVAIKDIKLFDGTSVEKDDVGVIKPESKTVFSVRLWQDVILSPDDYQILDVTKTGDEYPKKLGGPHC